MSSSQGNAVEIPPPKKFKKTGELSHPCGTGDTSTGDKPRRAAETKRRGRPLKEASVAFLNRPVVMPFMQFSSQITRLESVGRYTLARAIALYYVENDVESIPPTRHLSAAYNVKKSSLDRAFEHLETRHFCGVTTDLTTVFLESGRPEVVPDLVADAYFRTLKDETRIPKDKSARGIANDLLAFCEAFYRENQGRNNLVAKHVKSISIDTIRRLASRHEMTFRRPLVVDMEHFYDTNEVSKWFDDVGTVVSRANPHLVFNMDETSISGRGSKHSLELLVEKNQKVYVSEQEFLDSNVTFIPIICGDGTKETPAFLLHKLKNGFLGPRCKLTDSCIFEFTTSSGYITGESFEEILVNHITRMVTAKRDAYNLKLDDGAVLFLDGPRVHFSWEAFNKLRELNINVIVLPHNSTARMQPLDVSCFSTFKRNLPGRWNKHKIEKVQESGESRQHWLRRTLLEAVLETWDECVTRRMILNGFAACGLVPFCKTAVTESESFLRMADTEIPKSRHVCPSGLVNPTLFEFEPDWQEMADKQFGQPPKASRSRGQARRRPTGRVVQTLQPNSQKSSSNRLNRRAVPPSEQSLILRSAGAGVVEPEPKSGPHELPPLSAPGEGTPSSEAPAVNPDCVLPPLQTNASNDRNPEPFIFDSKSLRLQGAEPVFRSSDGSFIVSATESDGTIFIADEGSKAAEELDEASGPVKDIPDSFFDEVSEALQE